MRKFVLVLMCGFTSCALFKKTNREVALNSQTINKQSELSQLVLKTAGRETQIYTYWNDSGFYQYQRIMEQTDQTEMTKLEHKDERQLKQKITQSVSTPSYAFMLVLLLVIYLFFFGKRPVNWLRSIVQSFKRH